jgi:hypothetical protein
MDDWEPIKITFPPGPTMPGTITVWSSGGPQKISAMIPISQEVADDFAAMREATDRWEHPWKYPDHTNGILVHGVVLFPRWDALQRTAETVHDALRAVQTRIRRVWWFIRHDEDPDQEDWDR